MKQTVLLKTSALLAGLLMTVVGHAAYEGPTASAATTNNSLAAILKNPVEDQRVVLQGKLLKKTGKEEYLFSDGKDSITVEIDDDDMHAITVTENTLVEIVGEVDKKLFGGPEIEVKTIRVVTP